MYESVSGKSAAAYKSTDPATGLLGGITRTSTNDDAEGEEQFQLYEDFQGFVDVRRIQQHQQEVQDEESKLQWGADMLCTWLLPIALRTCLPIAAAGLSLLFRDFVSLLIFVGGVYASCVSIIIPTWSYYQIHHQDISVTEKYLIHGIIGLGVFIALATLLVFVL